MGWREMIANVQGTSVRTFPEPVLYTPMGLSEISITGIFREAFVSVDVENAVEIGSLQPTLDVVLDDLPALPSALPLGQGDRVVIVRTSLRYRIVEVNEDGEGMAKLYLHLEPTG